jgi:hypothetical protein
MTISCYRAGTSGVFPTALPYEKEKRDSRCRLARCFSFEDVYKLQPILTRQHPCVWLALRASAFPLPL